MGITEETRERAADAVSQGYDEHVNAVMDAVDAYMVSGDRDPGMRDKIVGAAIQLTGYVRGATPR